MADPGGEDRTSALSCPQRAVGRRVSRLLDHETIRDTLEGITDLHEMIAAVIRSALVDEALHWGLRSRLDNMRERLSRLEVSASKKRELRFRR